MNLRFTERADKDYAGLPVVIRKAFEKQLRFLLLNLGHPSLHAKKYSESMDVWQGRVTYSCAEITDADEKLPTRSQTVTNQK